MEPTFRSSLNWLHTWAGVVLGGLLFAIFWMGTLSVFDREIDRWMAPMTRLAAPAGAISVDALRPALQQAAAAKAPLWSVVLPTERQPTTRLLWRDGSGVVLRYLDPSTGAVLPDPDTWAGTRFLYPFHYMLHIRFRQIGVWLVGAAGMAMLALAVSGVVIHRKIFGDFFTFRADRKPRRLILDLHNVTGVAALPFHVMIALSGLIIFWSIYFPSGAQLAYADRQGFNADAFASFARPKLNRPGGEIASLDAMVAEAQRLWDGDLPRSLIVRHPGDAAMYVQINRPNEDRVATTADVAYFDGATGQLLHQRSDARPIMTAQRFISGLHLIQFRHWSLRWLYFALGLAGCVLIATGLLFWIESRRKRHAERGLGGVRVVEGLTIGVTSGIVIATLSFFVVNRLLPLGITVAGHDRAALEIWVFYAAWLATFAHAWLRPRLYRVWREQCWAVAGLAVTAVLLNWATTGDHLVRSLSHRSLWPIAGMDLLLLVGGVVAALAAKRLRQRAPAGHEKETHVGER
jgi:uncharacterized iron-regulated membrane protein